MRGKPINRRPPSRIDKPNAEVSAGARSVTMPNAAEKDLYLGLRQLEGTLPTSAYLDPGEYQRDLEAIWYKRWILVCRSADIAAPLAYKVFTIGSQEVLVVRDDTGVLARLPQHLPSSWLAALPGRERTAEGAAHHLPLSCMVLFAARRSRARSVEVAAGRLPEIRLSALFRKAGGVARLRLREPRRACDGHCCRHLRREFRQPRQLAARRPRQRPRLHQGHELQLEDLLGKLQRVPALPGRPQAPVESRADLRARA